jgi:hypothetical protein
MRNLTVDKRIEDVSALRDYVSNMDYNGRVGVQERIYGLAGVPNLRLKVI